MDGLYPRKQEKIFSLSFKKGSGGATIQYAPGNGYQGMPRMTIRFYEELNDFLPEEERKKDMEGEFEEGDTVGEAIAAYGIPISVVDLILVGGSPAGLDYRLGDGCRVSVYPVFERFDVEGVTLVREKPLRDPAFIADTGLEELASRMEEEGMDVHSDPALSFEELIHISNRERRVILTMRNIMKGSRHISRVIILEPGTVEEQLRYVRKAMFLEQTVG